MAVNRQNITQLVAQIRNAEEDGSITNVMVAQLGELLNSLALEIETAGNTTLSSHGNRLTAAESSLGQAQTNIAGMTDRIVSTLWKWALGDTYDSASFRYPVCDSLEYRLIRNGYFPEEDPEKPFWCFGKKLYLSQAIKVLFNFWSPMSKAGLLPFEARTHLPVSLYEGIDEAVFVSQFNLDMCLTGSGVMESVALRYHTTDFFNSVYSVYTDSNGEDVSGLDINAAIPCVTPQSMYRAFDGAKNLRQILGGIDCRLMGKNGMAFAYRGCRNLLRLRLFNIPDTISELDFSWSPDLSPVVLHQLTFRHGTSTIAARSAAAPEFHIYLHPDCWDNYHDSAYWSRIYATYTLQEWISTMKLKNVYIHLKDNETGLRTEYNVLEPA